MAQNIVLKRITKLGKILKGFRVSLYLIVEFLMLLLIFVSFAIRTSWFQTFAAHEVGAYLSSELGAEVSIDKVDIVFFDRVDLEKIYVEDTRHDTLLYTERLTADIEDWSLGKKFVNLSRVDLYRGKIHMRKYEGDSTLNFQHLVDYFSPEEPDTSKSAFNINVAAVWLEDIEFVFDDQNKPQQEHGMDYAHIHLNHFSSHFSDFSLNGDTIGVNIDDLHFQDRSGLTLNKLEGYLTYSPKGISVDKLRIGFNNSWLYAQHFKLMTPNGPEDWSDFVNKVEFDTKLKNCKLSFRDLAHFVPQMWGMTDRVRIVNIDASGPVFGMKLKNVDIRMLENTLIQGDFTIPNFSKPNEAFFTERLTHLQTSISDFEKLNLSPFLSDEDKQTYVNQYRKAGKIHIRDAHFDGFMNSFVVDGRINSGIGNFKTDYGLQFYIPEGDSVYYYDGPNGKTNGREVIVDNLDLAVITGNSILGPVTGYVKILPGSHGFSMEDIDIRFDGYFDRAYLNEYTYHKIAINNGRFENEVVDISKGDLTISDDNLALHYKGFVDLKGDMIFDFEVKVDSAHLAELTHQKDSVFHRLEANLSVRIEGKSLNTMRGLFAASNIHYNDGLHDFELDTISVEMFRKKEKDSLILRSNPLEIDLLGQFDLVDIHEVLLYQLSYVVDNLIDPEKVHNSKNEYFDLDIRMKDINPLIQFLDSDIYIAKESRIQSQYDKKQQIFALDFNSDSVVMGDMKAQEIKLEHHFDSSKALITYQAEKAQINDSTRVENFYLDSYVKQNKFLNTIGWDGVGNVKPALLAFHADVSENHEITTVFDPSFFYLKEHKWTISPESKVVYHDKEITFSSFKLYHAENYVSLEGVISENPKDWLKFTVHDFDLKDINGLLVGSGVELDGILNIKGGVADVYNSMKFSSDSDIDKLVINDRLVGNVVVRNNWNQATKSISMSGKLLREEIKTFTFNGNYFVDREKENIRMDLNFDKTDIAFLSAFEDPKLYTDIEGTLDGRLSVTGEIDNPVIKGSLNLADTRVFVPMFNVGYGLEGKVRLSEGAILGDFMKVYDQQGNQAETNLQIFHQDYKDWNYDITLDMDKNLVDKFYVLNTEYQEGNFYYGDAYVTGFVNISGYKGKTTIEVAAATEEGTDLTLPMYGTGELEDESFIQFIDTAKESKKNEIVTQIKSSGLDLKLKFNVTKDANVLIVFDPIYNDQIAARGNGDIEVTVDEYGEVKMFGTYVIEEGSYNMRMKNVLAEDFRIKKGSQLTWTQSPYDADINITAEFDRNVSMQPIMPGGQERDKVDNVIGSLSMKEKLLSPALGFDLRAPRTDELGAAALNKVKANPDVLKKQFFALLVLNKFLPTQGFEGTSGTNAALDFAEGKVNELLDQVGENYDLAADLSDASAKLNMETQLGDRVTVKTSLGVVSEEDEAGIVGDVSVEYRLNDDGTFSLTVFNESNTGSDAETGPFTQGVGLHYEESFRKARDFRLLQSFLNLFRKKENKVKLEKKRDKSDKYVIIDDEESTDSE